MTTNKASKKTTSKKVPKLVLTSKNLGSKKAPAMKESKIERRITALADRVSKAEKLMNQNDKFLTDTITNAAEFRTEFDNLKTEIVERLICLEQFKEDELVRMNADSLQNQGLIEQNQALLALEHKIQMSELTSLLEDSRNVSDEYRSQCLHNEEHIHSLQDQNQALLAELAEARETINRVEAQRQELEQLTYQLEEQIHSLTFALYDLHQLSGEKFTSEDVDNWII